MARKASRRGVPSSLGISYWILDILLFSYCDFTSFASLALKSWLPACSCILADRRLRRPMNFIINGERTCVSPIISAIVLINGYSLYLVL